MALTQDHFGQPRSSDQSLGASNSPFDSANGSLQYVSHSSPASVQSSINSDGLPGNYEKPPILLTGSAGSTQFQLSDSVNDANNAESVKNLLCPVTDCHECVSSQAQAHKDYKNSPVQLEEIEVFVERVAGKLSKSKNLYQKCFRDFVEPGTSSMNSKDAMHGSRQTHTLLSSPVFSSTQQNLTCSTESPTSGLVTTTSQSCSTPIRPPSLQPLYDTFPFDSSPLVGNHSEGLGIETAREIMHDYENLLKKAVCYFKQLLGQHLLIREMAPEVETVACGPGPGGIKGFEEAEEILLRHTEKKLREKVCELQEQLYSQDYKLEELEEEKESLREQSGIVQSSEEKKLEKANEKINLLYKKLCDEKNERDKAETDLSSEKGKYERCLRKLLNTRDQLQENNDRLLALEMKLSEQNDFLTKRGLEITNLRSSLDKKTEELVEEEEKFQGECDKLFAAENQLEDVNNKLTELAHVLERVRECIFMCGIQGEDVTMPNILNGGTSNRFKNWADYVFGILHRRLDECNDRNMSLKLVKTGEANMLDTIKKHEMTIKELRKEIDEHSKKLEHLQTSISACVPVVQKLKMQRIYEVNSLNDLLKRFCSFSTNVDTPNDDCTKPDSIDNFEICQTNFRTCLDELLSKLNTLGPVGLHTSEMICSNTNSSSFRDEQESVIDDSSEHSSCDQTEQPPAFEVFDRETLKDIDSNLWTTLHGLFHLKFTAPIQKTKTEELQRNEGFQIKIDRNDSDNSLNCDGLQTKLSEKSNESTVKQLNDLTGRIIVIDKPSDSESIGDDKFRKTVKPVVPLQIELQGCSILVKDMEEMQKEERYVQLQIKKNTPRKYSELQTDRDDIHGKADHITTKVKKLDKTLVRDLEKQLEERTILVPDLQKAKEMWQEALTTEEDCARQQLEVVAVMKADFTEQQLRTEKALAKIRARDVITQGDSNLNVQKRLTAHRRNELLSEADRRTIPPGIGGNKKVAAMKGGCAGCAMCDTETRTQQLCEVPGSMIPLNKKSNCCEQLLGASTRTTFFPSIPPNRIKAAILSRRSGSIQQLFDADEWMPKFVFCCVTSIAVVYYLYTQRPWS